LAAVVTAWQERGVGGVGSLASVQAAAVWRWQRNGGSTAAAAEASLVAEAARQKRIFGGSKSRPKHFLFPTNTWYA